MNRKSIIFFVIIFLIMPVLLMAQSSEKRGDYTSLKGLRQTKGFLDHLLNPDNFNMSHSYSISCFNLGRNTYSQGLYLNTLNYKFADPIIMQVRFGYLHHPFGMGGFNSANSNNSKFFIQRAMLKYKPSKNFSVTIDYQQIPQNMISPYGYYNRYRYNDNDFLFDR